MRADDGNAFIHAYYISDYLVYLSSNDATATGKMLATQVARFTSLLADWAGRPGQTDTPAAMTMTTGRRTMGETKQASN